MTKYKSCDKDHILMSFFFVTEQKYEAVQARTQGGGWGVRMRALAHTPTPPTPPPPPPPPQSNRLVNIQFRSDKDLKYENYEWNA